ncbi:MAG: START domain-containing protein [Bacteroidota bacterium]
MKTFSSVILKTVLLSLFILAFSYATFPENWKAVESKSGIQVFERWVDINKDLKVKERRGVIQVRKSLPEVVKTLKDPSNTRLWMEHVSDAYLVKQVSDNVWLSYTCFAIPWPFESRDMVSLSTLEYNNNGSSAYIIIRSKGEAIPVKPKTSRLNNFKACWEIKDLGKGQCSISFTAMTYAAPDYPRFIQDPVIRGTFYRNMLNLKTILDQ